MKNAHAAIAEAVEGDLRLLLLTMNLTGQQTDAMLPQLCNNLATQAEAALEKLELLRTIRCFRCSVDGVENPWYGDDESLRQHIIICDDGKHDEQNQYGRWVMVDWERISA